VQQLISDFFDAANLYSDIFGSDCTANIM